MELFSVFGVLRFDDSDFDRGISGATSSIGGLVTAVGAAAVAVGAAMVGIGAASLSLGDRMNQSLGGIQAQTGITSDEIAKLEGNVRDLALTQGRFTAVEMLGALESVAVRGMNATSMYELLESGMTFANATGNDLSSTLYFLSNYLLKVGKDSSYADKYVELFSRGISNTGISLANLQNYIFRMTPAFQQFGAGGETNIAILTRLYQAGIRGANLYSGMGTIMMELATSSGNANDMLHNFVFTMDNVVRSSGEVSDASMDVIDGLLRQVMAAESNEEMMFALAQAMSGATDVLEQYGLQNEIARIITGDLNAAQQAAWFEFMNLAEEIQNEVIPSFFGYGQAAEMAEMRTGGLGDGFGMLRNQGQEVLKTISDIIAQPFSEMLARASGETGGLVERLREGGDLHPKMVQLAEAIADLADRLLDAAVAMIPIITEWLPKFADWLSRLVGFIADNYKRIGALIISLKGLKVAFGVYKVIKTTTKALKGMNKTMNKTMKAMNFGKVAKGMNKASVATKGLGKSAKVANIGIGKAGKGILKALGPKGWVALGVIAGGALIIKNWDNIADGSERLAGRLRDWADDSGNIFADWAADTAEKFSDTWRNAGEVTESGLGGLAYFVADWQSQSSRLLVRWYGETKKTFANAWIEAGKETNGFFDRTTTAMSIFTRTIGGNLRDSTMEWARNWRDSFVDMGNSVQEGWGRVSELTRDAVNRITDGLRGKLWQFQDFGRNMMDAMSSGISSAASRMAETARSAVNGAINSARNALGINSDSRVFTEMGEYSGGGYIAGWERMYGPIKKAVGGALGSLYGYAIPASSNRMQPAAGPKRMHSHTGGSGPYYHIENLSLHIDADKIKDVSDIIDLLSDFFPSRLAHEGV